MKIVIIGAGEVGFTLAKRLSYEEHDLVLIDENIEKCTKVQEALDLSVIHGSGASQSVLIEAGLQSAEMLIAASGVDEVNILACMVASKMGVKRKIARVRNPEYYSKSSILSASDLGVDLFIHPEDEVTEEIVRLLMRSIASEIVEFENGKILMVGVKVDASCPILNMQLKNVGTEKQRRSFRVVAILKGNKTIIPDGNDYINKNDHVFVVTKAESLPEVLSLTGKIDQKLNKIAIMGGGMIGLGVASKLEQSGVDVTLIESDREKSIQIAGQLKKTMVVNADGTEIDVLAKEGILNMDAVVAVTSDDETNIITCLLAKHLGIQKTIALVNRVAYLPLMPVIGIDSTVNVRLSTVNAILHFVRMGEILSVATFHGIEAEAIEFEVKKDGGLTGKLLRQLKLPEGSLVAAIVRGNEGFIPFGDSIIKTGDKVIAFALPNAVRSLEKRFA
jgi:trk system potassium uptake protein TrkA